MRVLLIGGLAESLLNFRGHLLAEFISRGFEVHVAAPDLHEYSELCRHFEGRSVEVHDIPLRRTGTNPFRDLYLLCSLWGLMRQIQPDVVLGYTVKPVVYGTLAAWLAGVPRRYALITGLGYAFTGHASGLRAKVKGILLILYRESLRRAHKVFFQNSDDQALFRQLGLLLPCTPTAVVNGSGVDLARFSVEPLPSGAPHFLLIARLLRDKGVCEFAEAAQRIKIIHPNVEFSLVGWLDENPNSVSQAELNDWVQSGTLNYLGRLSDVRPAIANCSVFVLPSYREGTPRTVLEAMAMGRPVITTDAPGCRGTVVDGKTGFLVPIKSVDALVNAMENFIHKPDLAHRMGPLGRKLVDDKYDVRKVNAVMMSEMGF